MSSLDSSRDWSGPCLKFPSVCWPSILHRSVLPLSPAHCPWASLHFLCRVCMMQLFPVTFRDSFLLFFLPWDVCEPRPSGAPADRKEGEREREGRVLCWGLRNVCPSLGHNHSHLQGNKELVSDRSLLTHLQGGRESQNSPPGWSPQASSNFKIEGPRQWEKWPQRSLETGGKAQPWPVYSFIKLVF